VGDLWNLNMGCCGGTAKTPPIQYELTPMSLTDHERETDPEYAREHGKGVA